MSRRCAGFTLIELAVGVAVFGTISLAFATTFARSNALARASTATLQAGDDERRSLDAIAGALRGAAYESLQGFDEATGVALAPTFRRALGCDGGGLLLDTPETLSWRAVARPINGIAAPGEVVLVKDGTTTVVAPRVPKDGFRVTRSGNTLRIALTTFCSSSQRTVSTATWTTYVSLRN